MEQIVKVLHLDLVGNDDVVYPRDVILDALDDFKNRLRDNGESIPGECPVPLFKDVESVVAQQRLMSIMWSNVSHFVKSIWIDGDTVYAKINLIGKYADLALNGVEFAVLPRAVGNIDKDNKCSNYKLITLDLSDFHQLVE